MATDNTDDTNHEEILFDATSICDPSGGLVRLLAGIVGGVIIVYVSATELIEAIKAQREQLAATLRR